METNKHNKDEEMDEIGPPAAPARDLSTQFETVMAWKTVTKDQEVAGWAIGQLPGPTKYWQNLTDDRKKKVNGFLPEELMKGKTWPLALKDGWESLKQSFNVNQDECFGTDLGGLAIKEIGKLTDRSYFKGFNCLMNFPARKRTP